MLLIIISIFSRYGYVENVLNSKGRDQILNSISLEDVLYDALLILREEIDPSNCLKDYCYTLKFPKRPSTLELFRCQSEIDGFEGFKNKHANYSFDNTLIDLIRNTTKENVSLLKTDSIKNRKCVDQAKDFELLKGWRSHFLKTFSKMDIKKPGSLLRWLFVQTTQKEKQDELYKKYLGSMKEYSSESLGMAPDLSVDIPDLVDTLSETDLDNMKGYNPDKSNINSLEYNQKLLDIMKLSIQSPHLAENDTESGMIDQPPGAAFPFCHYGGEDQYNQGK